ncbi:lipopolysaccharide biosynthesis protein [Parapedobacter sp. ISTM3]|uniref:Wzz/FepE/Etk N-terminal domain-containing protein n=1 Tax=Parapedobacter sp. ISTM3 TaxID=2800130 RepID=UPI00190516A0|nr:Wzz/FepE/Etk N-terminal domain-containing protein [Parapedobacter sp. ISTM3]MBK1438373.1 lipopolysaccharide biosynthesis protein [Parapedobacter sp. ISTM3]
MEERSTYHTGNDDGSLRELVLSVRWWLIYLLSKWNIILIAVISGGIIGLCYSFFSRPKYTATTTFVLESSDSKNGLGRIAGVAAIAGINLSSDVGGLFQGNNILELYKSRMMLEKTLLDEVHPDSNELLIERYIAYNELEKDWKNKPELLALDFRKEPEALDSLSRRLRDGVIASIINLIKSEVLFVGRIENLSIIQVDVTSPDEVFSKAFNEKLVKNVNEFYLQTKTKKSTDNIAILEKKVDSVRNEMSEAIHSAARVSDVTPNLNPTRQAQRVVPVQEAQFSAEANKAILSHLLQNLELAKMNLLQEQPLIQVVDTPVYPLPIKKLGSVKGILIGGFLFGCLVLIFLITQKYYRNIITVSEKLETVREQRSR